MPRACAAPARPGAARHLHRPREAPAWPVRPTPCPPPYGPGLSSPPPGDSPLLSVGGPAWRAVPAAPAACDGWRPRPASGPQDPARGVGGGLGVPGRGPPTPRSWLRPPPHPHTTGRARAGRAPGRRRPPGPARRPRRALAAAPVGAHAPPHSGALRALRVRRGLRPPRAACRCGHARGGALRPASAPVAPPTGARRMAVAPTLPGPGAPHRDVGRG